MRLSGIVFRCVGSAIAACGGNRAATRFGFFPLSILTLSALAIPCVAQQPAALKALKANSVILFQGDSITDGGRARSGSDFNHTMGQDYVYILSALIGATYPERQLTFLNRGISGNRIADLAARWQTDTLALEPDMVSIMIGINDVMSSKDDDAKGYEATYDTLISDTLRALPGTKIVLIEPFVLPVGKYKEDYGTYRKAVGKHQAAVGRIATKYGLPLVHLQKAMDDASMKAPAIYWSWDGIHPNYAGHGLLVQEWMKTVNEAWP